MVNDIHSPSCVPGAHSRHDQGLPCQRREHPHTLTPSHLHTLINPFLDPIPSHLHTVTNSFLPHPHQLFPLTPSHPHTITNPFLPHPHISTPSPTHSSLTLTPSPTHSSHTPTPSPTHSSHPPTLLHPSQACFLGYESAIRASVNGQCTSCPRVPLAKSCSKPLELGLS